MCESPAHYRVYLSDIISRKCASFSRSLSNRRRSLLSSRMLFSRPTPRNLRHHLLRPKTYSAFLYPASHPAASIADLSPHFRVWLTAAASSIKEHSSHQEFREPMTVYLFFQNLSMSMPITPSVVVRWSKTHIQRWVIAAAAAALALAPFPYYFYFHFHHP